MSYILALQRVVGSTVVSFLLTDSIHLPQHRINLYIGPSPYIDRRNCISICPLVEMTAPSYSAIRPRSVIAFSDAGKPDCIFIGTVVAAAETEAAAGDIVYVDGNTLLQCRRGTPRGSSGPLRCRVLNPDSPLLSAYQRLQRCSEVTRTAVETIPPANSILGREEQLEMRHQHDELQEDLQSSKMRVAEIEKVLRRMKASPVVQRSSSNSPRPLRPTEARERAALDVAERALVMARAGLRAVKPVVWQDLHRQKRGAMSAGLVALLEAAVAFLEDGECVSFEEAVQQGQHLVVRLTAVKAETVQAATLRRPRRFMATWSSEEALDKEHRAASALYKWVKSMIIGVEAYERLRQSVSPLTSPDDQRPLSSARQRPAAAITEEELQLRKELKDQREYMEMAEEELRALDELLAAIQATTPLHPETGKSDGTATSAAALPLVIPRDQVLCVLPKSEAPPMKSCAALEKGTAVSLSSKAIRIIISASEARMTASVPVVPQLRLDDVRQLSNIGSAAATSAVPQETVLSKQPASLTAQSASGMDRSPRAVELQLLRNELAAKSEELQRVEEERDKLLFERRGKNTPFASAVRRSFSESLPRPIGKDEGKTATVVQMSTPREMVDRSIVEELEEQLSTAHRCVKELQAELSAIRRPSPASPSPPPAEAPRESSEVASTSPTTESTATSPAPIDAATIELQQRLDAAVSALETQNSRVRHLEQQLNDAMHRQREAEHAAGAQRKEVAELWARLESTEAQLEKLQHHGPRRVTVPNAQQLQEQQPETPAHNISLVLDTESPNAAAMQSPERDTVSQQEDVIATTASASRLTSEFPTPAAAHFPSFGVAPSVSNASGQFVMGNFSQTSVPLYGRPIDQLTLIELRYEVHRLREDVERYQSTELRLSIELQAVKERQLAIRRRAKETREANSQAVNRMMNNAKSIINNTDSELQSLASLLRKSKEDLDTILSQH